MPDTAAKSPVDDLEAFRSLLVGERRQRIRTALELKETNGELGKSWAAELLQLQTQIEAVDRAILDEQTLRPSVAIWEALGS